MNIVDIDGHGQSGWWIAIANNFVVCLSPRNGPDPRICFLVPLFIKRIHILCLQNGVFSPRQKLCRKNLTSSEHWEQQESTVSPRDRIGLPRNMNVRENSWAKWKQENRKNKETGLFRNICGGGCNRNRVNQKKGKSSPVMAEVAWNSCHVIRSLSHGSIIRCSLAHWGPQSAPKTGSFGKRFH